MKAVRPKKSLGQHFLTDLDIAQNIVAAVTYFKDYKLLLEIGPGMGVLTQYLVKNKESKLYTIDIDRESIAFLHRKFPELKATTIEGDFLRLDLKTLFNEPFGIIGNFPYNISSQIFFKALENRDMIPEIVCMLQKEVAERLASKPGNKTYGILSVFLQAFYTIEYLFTVNEDVFNPPPKVKSGVIRLKRNERQKLDCDEKFFFVVVKQGFQNRRKTLRNALKSLNLPVEMLKDEVLDKRAEQLSVEDFVLLTNRIQAGKDGI